MSILPRPLRLSRTSIAGSIFFAGFLFLMGAMGLAGAILSVVQGEWSGLLLLVLTLSFSAAYGELQTLGDARLLAADGEEVVGQLVLQQDQSMRDQHGRVHHWRDYRLFVDGAEVPHRANGRHERPLFLDEAHTQALCVRSKSQPHVIRIVRNDLKPFAVSDGEYRALKERIEELRQVKKLVSDIHTC
jgi:hypothetical protein